MESCPWCPRIGANRSRWKSVEAGPHADLSEMNPFLNFSWISNDFASSIINLSSAWSPLLWSQTSLNPNVKMSSLSSSKAMLNSSRALRSKPSSSSSILPSSTLPTLQSTRSFHLTATRSSSSTPPSESKPKTKTSLLSPLSPSAPPPSSKPYSPLTISFVKGLARLMGYN